ncbi:MAG: glycosyltransferase family 39 protein [Candidatus Hydrogenedentes bacterium]|nr:glycosyltransferase family 39 protein [Candidatus Hydrogenedentota bacterium]
MTELDTDQDSAPEEVSPRLGAWLDVILRIYHSPVLLWVILLAGITVRLLQFLHGRDLWHDEASLALNIHARSYLELLKPLDYEQAAPAGFLVLTKLAVAVFGDNNYGMRVVPFASSIATLLLLWPLARRWVRPSGVPLALALFAASTSFIDFSANLKQYTLDAAVTMVILLCADQVVRRSTASPGNARQSLAVFGIAGAVAVWFSFTAVFVLAAAGLCLASSSLLRRDWKNSLALALMGGAWGVSFAIYYLICLRSASTNDFLLRYWAGAFMPLPPRRLSDLTWFTAAFSGLFSDTALGLIQAGLGMFAFVLGCVALALTNRLRLAMVLAPIGVTLLASGVHKYPFADRLLMFLAPVLLIGIGEGAGFLTERARGRYALVAVVFLVCAFADQGVYAARRCAQPYEMQEISGVMDYLKSHRQPGDTIYVYHYADRAFLYYADRYGLQTGEYTLGIRSLDDSSQYLADLDKLKGKTRVWVVSVVIYQNREFNILLTYLDHIGKQLDAHRGKGADVFLYDLR